MIQLKVFLFVFLAALIVNVHAQQTGVFKGRVLDADNLSMPGATVILKSFSE